MTSRVLAGQKVNALGYGAMNIVHGYSNFPTPEATGRLLNEVLDAGVNHIDTATLYGGRRSEELIGEHLKHRRDEYFLASKGGLSLVDGRSVIDGRPELLLAQVDASLQQLQTDRIDLYYLHRLDPKVPVEESVGALAQAVAAGKIGGIGLSEISAATLRKAHAVHPIDAVQNEYSLATRNPEIAMLDACAELGTAFVAFSPLYRGYLSGNLRDIESLPEKDIRHFMPRFRTENYPQNLVLVDPEAAGRAVGNHRGGPVAGLGAGAGRPRPRHSRDHQVRAPCRKHGRPGRRAGPGPAGPTQRPHQQRDDPRQQVQLAPADDRGERRVLAPRVAPTWAGPGTRPSSRRRRPSAPAGPRAFPWRIAVRRG